MLGVMFEIRHVTIMIRNFENLRKHDVRLEIKTVIIMIRNFANFTRLVRALIARHDM